MRARGHARTLAFPETERRRNVVTPLEDVGLPASPQRNCPRPPDSMGRLNLCIVNYSAGPCCSISVRTRCKRETGVQVHGVTGLRGASLGNPATFGNHLSLVSTIVGRFSYGLSATSSARGRATRKCRSNEAIEAARW